MSVASGVCAGRVSGPGEWMPVLEGWAWRVVSVLEGWAWRVVSELEGWAWRVVSELEG